MWEVLLLTTQAIVLGVLFMASFEYIRLRQQLAIVTKSLHNWYVHFV
jgi:hypothetical protein